MDNNKIKKNVIDNAYARKIGIKWYYIRRNKRINLGIKACFFFDYMAFKGEGANFSYEIKSKNTVIINWNQVASKNFMVQVCKMSLMRLILNFDEFSNFRIKNQ